MKIELSYDPELKLLKVPVTIKTPHKRSFSTFIFDTGSPNTLLNYTVSRVLEIPFNEESGIIKIGGSKYKAYKFDNIEFVFKSIDNQGIIEKFPVKVLRPSSIKSNELSETDRFPNILGIDFLELGWKFFCDLKTKEIYFEKEED
ncbi:MAG: hypothetical protein AABX54_02655 [Nanoarchaeota archaeon]